VNAGAISLGRGQHRQGADVLVASHADYPAFRHIFPDPRRRLRALRPFFAATLRDAIPFGSAYAGTDASAMAAVAVWLPPGAFPWTSTRQARAAPALTRTMIAAPRAFPSFISLGANATRAVRGVA
jgi:hypothetical protein